MINSAFVCMCVWPGTSVEADSLSDQAGCEWWVIRSRPLIFCIGLHLKLTETSASPLCLSKTHTHIYLGINIHRCTHRQTLTVIDQSWRRSRYPHSSTVSPGSCYRLSFTVCLIHSQRAPATASTSHTSLSVYRPDRSTTSELSACIFTMAVLLQHS